MEKKSMETFKEYAHRWRDAAAQVQLPLTEKEITVLFVNTLKAPYYDRLVENATKNFSDMVISGKMIENAIKSGKIEGSEKNTVTVKKKEQETYAVTHRNPSHYLFVPYNPYPPYYPATNQVSQQPYHYRAPQQPLPRPSFSLQSSNYTSLMKGHLVVPTYAKSLRPPYPSWYDPNVKCDYHYGVTGHSTENCTTFKHKVQGLINDRLLSFDTKFKPNVSGNPLSDHIEGKINMVGKEKCEKIKRCTDEVRTPFERMYDCLYKTTMIQLLFSDDNGNHEDPDHFCKYHGRTIGHSIQNCEVFKQTLQSLMDKAIIEFYDEYDENSVNTMGDERPSKSFIPKPLTVYYDEKSEPLIEKTIFSPRTSMTIHVPSPFPYQSNKAVSWRYDYDVAIRGPNITSNNLSIENTANIAGVGGMTRSGQIYTPEMSESVRKGKDKIEEEDTRENEDSQPVLNKLPARISLLSLLLNSESHRNALLKVLNQAYVEHNISVEKVDHMIGNIIAPNFITFNDDEIPPEGRGSVKALHVTVKCKSHTMAKVLIDNGSSINVIPLTTLSKLSVDLFHMRNSHMIVKAFDGHGER
ncbi:uncharacterized protein LOC111309436 [Durio zibethinus]|uniref:Uncharacterized protein LOC111309436 n=1 Tax=Durio zibethinus TaxID=66656 RepID=A0A6P6AHE7_DURZI|nr:uncharacterized protein LOC111309436 [Durio zibethinus]